MKKLFVIALALALTAGAAYANYCARDYVPAATLLVPYAVVDMDATGLAPDANGYTTLLSVTNVSSEAQLIHVTVWSPLSNAIVDFDEVLTGYDVWTINFRDLLTGHFDAFDTGSRLYPDYPVDAWGPTTNCVDPSIDDPEDVNAIDTTGCAFPYDYNPSYGAGIVGALRADTFAIVAQRAGCSPDNHPSNPPWLSSIIDDPLFFYVTIDVVRACNLWFPNTDAYWNAGASNFPTGENVLLGEVIWANASANYSEALPAVHIEWDNDVFNANSNDAGYPTFYGLAYGDEAPDALLYDGTEPLATAFGFRYYNSMGASTQLVVWKSDHEVLLPNPYADADLPYIYYAWDENEQSRARTQGPSGFDRPEPNVIPWETQAAPLDVLNWNGLMEGNGWMLLIFDPSVPVIDGGDYEAWVGVRYLFGTYSAALEAATMANANCFREQTLPFGLGINYDYDAYYWD